MDSPQDWNSVVQRANIRVLIVAWSNSGGGAANATARIFKALVQRGEAFGIDIRLWTVVGKTNDDERHVLGFPERSKVHQFFERWIWFLRRGPRHVLFRSPSYLATSADIPTGGGRRIKKLNPDVVNLHWLGNRTISIQEIGHLGIPTIWTLSDEWLVSGSLHYAISGLPGSRRSVVDGWVRFLKRRYLTTLFVIVKSNRLAERVRTSELGGQAFLAVMPNPIDVEFWRPVARRGFRADRTIHLCFGFSGRQAAHRKGADFVSELVSSIYEIERNRVDARLILSLFGDASLEVVGAIPTSVEVRVLGKLGDEELRALYNEVDFVLVLSRVDNTPNIVIEAMACGAIVVAREGSGAEDLLEDGRNGMFWRESENAQQLSRRMFALSSQDLALMQMRATRKIQDTCSEEAYSRKYAQLVRGVLFPETAKDQGWASPPARP